MTGDEKTAEHLSQINTITQFLQDGKISQAVAQYEELDRHDPGNPDHLREWGKLLLKDTGRPEEERRQAAAAVWKRLLDARPLIRPPRCGPCPPGLTRAPCSARWTTPCSRHLLLPARSSSIAASCSS